MPYLIDAFVDAIGAADPKTAPDHLIDVVLAAIGGKASPTEDDEWQVLLAGPEIRQAVAVLQRAGGRQAVKVEFLLDAGGVPLDRVTRDPAAWKTSPPMPDSGRVSIQHDWFHLPSGLSVTCSGHFDDARRLCYKSIACFVARL